LELLHRVPLQGALWDMGFHGASTTLLVLQEHDAAPLLSFQAHQDKVRRARSTRPCHLPVDGDAFRHV
jgi:hypothetical protein